MANKIKYTTAVSFNYDGTACKFDNLYDGKACKFDITIDALTANGRDCKKSLRLPFESKNKYFFQVFYIYVHLHFQEAGGNGGTQTRSTAEHF